MCQEVVGDDQIAPPAGFKIICAGENHADIDTAFASLDEFNNDPLIEQIGILDVNVAPSSTESAQNGAGKRFP